MARLVSLFLGVAITADAAAIAGRAAPAPVDGTAIYDRACAGCHGRDLAGGRGPSLFDPQRLARLGDAGLRAIVLHGRPGTEMPAFADQLSDEQVAAVIAFMHDHPGGVATSAGPAETLDGREIRSERQRFRITVVASGLDTPWGLAFLPLGRLLVTERSGRLRIVDHGRLSPEPVAGTPGVWTGQDAGLLDVAVPPGDKDGWIYLAYTDRGPLATGPDGAPRPTSMTVLVRGKLDRRHHWIAQQEIFRAPASFYTTSGSHYGARFLFDRDGHVFFSLGERGAMHNAQDLATPLGKIHRVMLDGATPPDNPFVHTPGASPSIWSYGHRNPEGLAFNPADGRLWESEHGPDGGDEINVIRRGRNYGWGVVSMGKQPGITAQSAPGMEPPVAWYTPRIAPSGIGFYTGTRYPGWRGSLFVGGLAGQQLRRLEVKGDRVTHQEVVFQGLGRVRAVATGPDGLLYLLIQQATGAGTKFGLTDPSPGVLARLEPLP